MKQTLILALLLSFVQAFNPAISNETVVSQPNNDEKLGNYKVVTLHYKKKQPIVKVSQASPDIKGLATFIKKHNKHIDNYTLARIVQGILIASTTYNVNYKFIAAVIAVESSFRPQAISPSGALGLGQLMPSTAKRLGVKNPFDPAENIIAMTKLLRSYYLMFNHNVDFVLAAYKGGAGHVKRYRTAIPATSRYIHKIKTIQQQIP